MDELKRNGTLHLKPKKQTYIKSALLVIPFLVASCVPSQSGGSKRSSGASGITNSPSSVSVGYGRVLHDNPIILSGKSNLSEDVNLSTLLKSSQDFITNEQTLTNKSCKDGTNGICFNVFKDKFSNPIQATNGKWAFSPDTYEFMQVQMFSDMNSMLDKYKQDINSYKMNASLRGLVTSFPGDMTKAQWFDTTNENNILTGFAHCEDAPDNAYFDPSEKIICLGFDSIYNQVKFVHDPTVLYHELGHALVLAAMNMRNNADSNVPVEEANLGYFSYDEGRSINEGLADYFSYYMNGRPFLGEWAFGRFLNLGRPMSESSSIHSAGIQETFEGRLSYPTFLGYNPNTPTDINEDVHYAGQIISHFLVAFTKDMEQACSFSNEQARSMTFNYILQTLAYLGDLTSSGIDGSSLRVNHSRDNAVEWLKKNKPVTFRTFAQTFSRYVVTSIGTDQSLCNGTNTYARDRLEQLLDSYGLLLFKNYEIDGNLHTSANLTKVSPLNRQKTVLIKKNQLFVDNRENAVKAYIFDGYDDMNGAASALTSGLLEEDLSPTIFENGNLKYNNGNSLISPGELVGVLINLYNNSNSEMAGVRILANDWDHMDNGKPCNNFSDNFPSESQGGVSVTTNPACATEDFNHNTKAPVCFFQDSKDNSTVWVSQQEFMTSRAIEATECLGGSSSTDDCLIRSPKGADVAWFSKINSKSTWIESLTDSNGNTNFKASNLIFLEVSPSIPPGTTINCRFRASFTNCDDCHNYQQDGSITTDITGNQYSTNVYSGTEKKDDEYRDYKYSGADPFVIINYQFTVID